MTKDITIKLNKNEFESVLATIIYRYKLLNEHGKENIINFCFKCKELIKKDNMCKTKKDIEQLLEVGYETATSFDKILNLFKD